MWRYTMKAFAITARDTSPAVQELPQPQPAPGEVLVAMEAASINGFDLSVAAGYVWDMLPHEFPVVLGRDFVGTVAAVGDGVEQVAVGDRVAGVIPGVALGAGALGEYVTVPATAVTTVPVGVDLHQAAAVGLAGVAAHDALEALDPRPGEVVLVSGATGGVGTIAVQRAVAAGASVIATARPGHEEEYVRGLGATHTVDYTVDVPAAVRAMAPEGVDKVLHFAGDPGVIGRTVRGGGAVVSTMGVTAAQLGRDDVTVTPIMAAATAYKLARLLDDLAAGSLHVTVEATVPLEHAHEALKVFGDGTLGKVLITR
jgi:NADPH:quinone reductase-like Zn-dependent oxidoreductase